MTRADLVARPPAPDPARASPRAPRRLRRGRARGRVRRELPHLRADRHRRSLRPAHAQPPVPRLRRPRAHLAARRRRLGRHRDGRHRAPLPALHAAPGRQPARAPSTASPPIDVGAVVNGPNGKDNFEGGLGGFQDGMRHCTAASRRLDRFDGHGRPVRRRRPGLADRRAGARHDRCRDHRSRGRAAAPPTGAGRPRRLAVARAGSSMRPGTPRMLRGINDRAALDLLLEHGPLSRTRLGELTGLSKPTASQLLSRLEAAGLVVASGSSRGGPGPRAQLYAVNPRRRPRGGARRHPGAGAGRGRGHHRPHRRRARAAHAAAPRTRRRGDVVSALDGRRHRRRCRPGGPAPRRDRDTRRVRPAHAPAALRPPPARVARPPPARPARRGCRSPDPCGERREPRRRRGARVRARSRRRRLRPAAGSTRASAPRSSSVAGSTAA